MISFRKCRFAVEGLNIERLIARASAEGVQLQSIRRTGARRIEGIASERDLAKLHSLAQVGGWRLEEGRSIGITRIADVILRHKMLFTSLLCMCLIAGICTGWIWRIEITGPALYHADISAYLNQEGVKPPVLRSSIDTDLMEDALQWRYPDVSWIECALRGVTLEIRIHDGVSYGESVTFDGSGDIVASRDGMITKIIATAGTPAVKPGQAVRAGDMLIRGEERQKDGSLKIVKAGGTVLARVWDTATASVPLERIETIYTGEMSESLTVLLPWFPLWLTERPQYTHFDTHTTVMPLGGLFVPLFVRRTTSHEYVPSAVMPNAAEAKEEAADAAYIMLLRKTGYDDDFVDKWVEYSMIEDEIVCASAYGERIIDIAADAAP